MRFIIAFSYKSIDALLCVIPSSKRRVNSLALLSVDCRKRPARSARRGLPAPRPQGRRSLVVDREAQALEVVPAAHGRGRRRQVLRPGLAQLVQRAGVLALQGDEVHGVLAEGGHGQEQHVPASARGAVSAFRADPAAFGATLTGTGSGTCCGRRWPGARRPGGAARPRGRWPAAPPARPASPCGGGA